MAKVFLTNEQKLEARNAEMRHRIADGLCVTKNRTKMSMEEIAKKAGVGRMTVSHLLCGDDVEIKLSSLIRLLDLAGLVIRQRTEEKL
jgi:transcriptional regulator with XRE-family HTH domain